MTIPYIEEKKAEYRSRFTSPRFPSPQDEAILTFIEELASEVGRRARADWLRSEIEKLERMMKTEREYDDVPPLEAEWNSGYDETEYVLVPVQWLETLQKVAMKNDKDKRWLMGYISSVDTLLKYGTRTKN